MCRVVGVIQLVTMTVETDFLSLSFSLRGRFGQVHKCVENSSGLTLAAKVIKARAQKENPEHTFIWRDEQDIL